MAIPGITWDEIWLPNSGSHVNQEHKNFMQRELEKLGYTANGHDTCKIITIEDNYYNKAKAQLGLLPKCSIKAAIAYIINTQPILFDKEKKLMTIENEYKEYKYQYDNFDKIYNTTQLINQPTYTDKMTTNTDWSYGNLKGVEHPNKKINYTYALSCWLYIHPNASNKSFSNNTFASIIKYGDKPKISYKQSTHTLKIEVQTKKNPEKLIYKTNNLPLQKWNYILLNFHGGTLDVFINNKLVATQKKIIPYLTSDSIVIGEKNGVSGGICNIVYYPSTLSTMKMNMLYNTLKIKNPPVLLEDNF